MKGSRHLNGSDFLMLGFDHELRRRGFAGNSCQIVLELSGTFKMARLQSRIDEMWKRYPILGAHPGGVVMPFWKLPRRSQPAPRVRDHRSEPDVCVRLLNEPLATGRGELIRFDLVELPDGKTRLVFTWTHALMDAPGAEHLLAVLGREELAWPAAEWAPAPGPQMSLTKRCKLAWKNLHQIDQFCRNAPRSLGCRHVEAPPSLRYRVHAFTTQETERVRANSVRYCGVLGAAQFHAAVSVLELHALHQRLGAPSPSYVLPIPVGVRPKGSVEPLFSNQVAMLMVQFLPEQLASLAHVVSALKTQMAQTIREGLLESGRICTELFRFLPVPIYMAVLKQGLRGEICSLFYGDTAAVSPQLNRFLGASIEDLSHVAAVTPTPGLGVIFYYFGGTLRVTVLHAATVLSEAEADEFASRLKARLIES